MLSRQTPTIPGFPRLKREWIILLSTYGLFKGNVRRFALDESTGMDFTAEIQVLGRQHHSGKPGTPPSPQALF